MFQQSFCCRHRAEGRRVEEKRLRRMCEKEIRRRHRQSTYKISPRKIKATLSVKILKTGPGYSSSQHQLRGRWLRSELGWKWQLQRSIAPRR